jgi:hypothetical protein
MLVLSWLILLIPFLFLSYATGYAFFCVNSDPDDNSFTIKLGVGSFFLAGATSLMVAIVVALQYLVTYYA